MRFSGSGRMPRPRKNLTGSRFGMLTVESEAERHSNGKERWHCQCDCGLPITVLGNNLKTGNTTSCGCKPRKHGLLYHPLYNTWQQMRQRCNNPRHHAFQNYGGRGITVCSRWNNFACFVEDMGDRPSDEYTIDRIDNDKGYFPRNCRWATHAEQGENKRAAKGEFHGCSKLRESQVQEIRRRHAEGQTCQSLARHFPVSCSTIKKIVARKTWKHVP